MPTAVWSNEPTTAVLDTLTLNITFDEPITGFAAGDLRLRRISDNRNYAPTAAQTTFKDLGSNVWEVKIDNLENLIGQQNTEFSLRLRWFTVFFETSQQNGPNAAADSTSFTIDTTPQPIPVAIGAFAKQNITINTEVALDINITGNPDDAYIDGLLEGFYTNWVDPTLQVRGTATRLVNNSPFTVEAVKGSNAPVTRSGTFSVVPAAPVISSVPRQTLIRGFENEIIVPVSNNPSSVRAKGKWSGMKYEPHPDGIRIFGTVPAKDSAKLTFEEDTITVYAETGSLTDQQEIEVSLAEVFFYGVRNTDDIYRIKLIDDGEDISSDLDFATNIGQIRYLVIDDTYIYFKGIGNRDRIYRVPLHTSDGQSVNATQIARFSFNGFGIAIDGNDGYTIENTARNEQIRVFNKNTGATLRTFRLDWNYYGRGIAIDGDDIIVVHIQDDVNYARRSDGTTKTRQTTRTPHLQKKLDCPVLVLVSMI